MLGQWRQKYIEQVSVKSVNQKLYENNSLLYLLKHNIETILRYENNTTLADIEKCLGELQAELLKLTNAGWDDLRKWIADMSVSLIEHPIALAESDESLILRLIEKNHRLRGQIHHGIQVQRDGGSK